MTCEDIRRGEIAERYVAGGLGETDREAFEAHFIECPDCLQELELLQDLRTELQSSDIITRREPGPGRGFQRWMWLAAVAAVVMIDFVLWTALGVGWRDATQPLSDAFAELSRLEPPPYRPAVVRGAQEESARLFKEAMEHYRVGEYERAIPGRVIGHSCG